MLIFIGALLIYFGYSFMPAEAQEQDPNVAGIETTVPTPFMSARIEQPVFPDNPLMPDKGEQTYYLLCMPCHGDRGQGLTEEFRREAYRDDMNCWQSKCHASFHPEGGFTFPKVVPAVIGATVLARFETGQQLSTYIQENMPFYKPLSLSEQDSLELTAYLLREKGALPSGVEYQPEDVYSALVHSMNNPVSAQQKDTTPVLIALVLTALGLFALMIVIAQISRRQQS